MILFDKLSYSSPVRQTSPALKSLFAVGSLVICVSFRQVSVCVLVLCCMVACTLQFANVTPRRYLRFLLGPLVFLALSSVAVLFLSPPLHRNCFPSGCFPVILVSAAFPFPTGTR